jgi:lysophospholipase L1-like esterase
MAYCRRRHCTRAGPGVLPYLHGVAASYGFSARAVIAHRLLAPIYAALPRHAAVVMLGDSITQWTDWNAKRIDSVNSMHPRCVAIMVGVNDLRAKRSVQQILQNYSAIVDRLSTSGSTVILQSILITSDLSLNALVIDVDRSLADICKRSGRCLYLDLNSTVASTGAIADSIDGLHLGPNSYKIWASTLTPLLDANCR